MQDILAQIPNTYREYDEQAHTDFNIKLYLNSLAMLPEAVLQGKFKASDINVFNALSVDEFTGAIKNHKSLSVMFLSTIDALEINVTIGITIGFGSSIDLTISRPDKPSVSARDIYSGLPPQILNLSKFILHSQLIANRDSYESISRALGGNALNIVNSASGPSTGRTIDDPDASNNPSGTVQ